MSVPVDGRTPPRKSVVTAGSVTPAPIAGEPLASSRLVTGGALEGPANLGSARTSLAPCPDAATNPA